MIKIYILIVILGLVGGVVYGGYYYYKDTQARIATLTENSAKLEQATNTQKQTIDTLVADAAKFQQLNKELAKLSLKKPGLVEKKINNGTKKLFESFEKLSGAAPIPTAPVK